MTRALDGAALVCPDCKAPLSNARCPQCRAEFSQHPIPQFYPPKRAAEIAAQLAQFQTHHAAVRQSKFFRALIPPNPNCDPDARRRESRVRELTAAGLVLNLGAKSSRWGAHVLNIDLAAPDSGAIDMLCDITSLPFADASVDGIICTYVLEHVADARACIAEFARVLKPGGVVYVTVPFVFPYHPDPLDRWRWTLDGLRAAFHNFTEIEAGPCAGPFSAYVALAPAMAASLFSNFYLFNATRFALGWLLWPLKFLDHLTWKNPRATTASANFYFLGKMRV